MLQYICGGLFFILTILYFLLAIFDRKTDLERVERDDADMEEYLVKLRFKADPARYYLDSLKQKE